MQEGRQKTSKKGKQYFIKLIEKKMASIKDFLGSLITMEDGKCVPSMHNGISIVLGIKLLFQGFIIKGENAEI